VLQYRLRCAGAVGVVKGLDSAGALRGCRPESGTLRAGGHPAWVV